MALRLLRSLPGTSWAFPMSRCPHTLATCNRAAVWKAPARASHRRTTPNGQRAKKSYCWPRKRRRLAGDRHGLQPPLFITDGGRLKRFVLLIPPRLPGVDLDAVPFGVDQ